MGGGGATGGIGGGWVEGAAVVGIFWWAKSWRGGGWFGGVGLRPQEARQKHGEVKFSIMPRVVRTRPWGSPAGQSPRLPAIPAGFAQPGRAVTR
jgi:hypothetical protein